MTPLRRRMIEDLTLASYAENTIRVYVRAVAQLAAFYGRSPDQLSEEDIRRYLLHLTTVKKVARSTHTVALCGIKFFYERTLGRKWTVFDLARPRKSKKLPVVLSRDEVWEILAHVRNASYRICLTTIYSCGLRLSEGAHLRVEHVDGARRMLRVPGKGGKERCVPLPEATLELLRQHWRTHKDQSWIFPATHPRSRSPSVSRPVEMWTSSAVWNWTHSAVVWISQGGMVFSPCSVGGSRVQAGVAPVT